MKLQNEDRILIAFVSTLSTIVLLCILAVIAVELADTRSEGGVAKLVAQLGFIGLAISGLIGVIGGFRLRQQGTRP